MMSKPINPQKRNWMIEKRKEKGLTLKGIAKKLGCSYQHYHDVEQGRRNPSFELSYKMSKFFNVPITVFLDDRTKFESVKLEESHIEKQP